MDNIKVGDRVVLRSLGVNSDAGTVRTIQGDVVTVQWDGECWPSEHNLEDLVLQLKVVKPEIMPAFKVGDRVRHSTGRPSHQSGIITKVEGRLVHVLWNPDGCALPHVLEHLILIPELEVGDTVESVETTGLQGKIVGRDQGTHGIGYRVRWDTTHPCISYFYKRDQLKKVEAAPASKYALPPGFEEAYDAYREAQKARKKLEQDLKELQEKRQQIQAQFDLNLMALNRKIDASVEDIKKNDVTAAWKRVSDLLGGVS